MKQNLFLEESVKEKIMREYRLILGWCVRKVTYERIHPAAGCAHISFFAACATFARAYKRFAILSYFCADISVFALLLLLRAHRLFFTICATFAYIKPFLLFVLLLRAYKLFCYLCYICAHISVFTVELLLRANKCFCYCATPARI